MQRVILAVVILLGSLLGAKAYFSATSGQDLIGTEKQFQGWNTDIDNGTVETITDNGTYNWPTAADNLTVVSSSTADKGGNYAAGSFTVVDSDQMELVSANGAITVVDWQKVKPSKATGSITIVDFSTFTGIKASATITINAYASIVNGTVLTLNGQTSNLITESASNGWLAATSNNATANGLAAKITAFGNGFTASAASGVVTVSYTSNGSTGNSKTIALNHTNGMTLSAATLSGGRPLLVFGINGTNLTANTSFLANGSNQITAAHLAAAINGAAGLTEVSAIPDRSIVYITATSNGTAGNLHALSSNNINGATVSASTLLGGSDNLVITLNGVTLTEGTDFSAAVNIPTTVANIIAAINSNLTTMSAAAVAGQHSKILLTANGTTYPDENGNDLAIAVSDINGATVSASTLLGGEDKLTITVNGKTFAAGTAFEPGASNGEAAIAIAAMLNANGHLASKITASASGRVVSIVADTIGTAANSITTSSNDSDSLTAATATLTGGRAAGVGANTIYLSGVNGGYQEVSETITLNGTTAQTTTNTYLRLNSAEVLTSGANGENVGTVSIKHNGTVLVGKALAGNNKIFPGVYTVPLGKTIYVTDCYSSLKTASTSTGGVTVELQSRPYGGVFSTDIVERLEADGDANCNSTLQTPLSIPAKSDIKLKGTTNTTDANVFAGFRFIEL